MGYEITFHFHEEITKGEYNKEETKTKVVKIGTPTEDIPLDAVASRIMSQLARRNILVVDVEIYEYTKKKLSYKETPDGIKICNKKFSFDDGVNLSCTESPLEEVDPQVGQLVNNQQGLQQLLAALLAGNQNMISTMIKTGDAKTATGLINVAPPTPSKVASLRHEMFNPVQKEMIADCKKRGMIFTLGKTYPIINERMAPSNVAGMMYTTIDDTGKRYTLSDKFFTPEVANLEFSEIFEEDFVPAAMRSGGKSADGLDWGDAVIDGAEVVNVRQR